MVITKQALSEMRIDFNEALKEVAASHDVSVSFGNCSYSTDGNEATFKVKVLSKQNDGNVFNPEKQNFMRYASCYGLSPSDFGKTFKLFDNKTYTICGLKPRASKYPVLGEEVGTKKIFKFSASSVIHGLSLMVKSNV